MRRNGKRTYLNKTPPHFALLHTHTHTGTLAHTNTELRSAANNAVRTHTHTDTRRFVPHVHILSRRYRLLGGLLLVWISNPRCVHLRLTISPANLYLVTTRSSAMVFSTISFSSAMSCLFYFCIVGEPLERRRRRGDDVRECGVRRCGWESVLMMASGESVRGAVRHGAVDRLVHAFLGRRVVLNVCALSAVMIAFNG